MLAICSLTFAHVPTYGKGCVDNCCVPEHADLRLSQVLYLKGSGGIEIPLDGADPEKHPTRAAPIGDTGIDGFRVYFDVVFRDLHDPVTGEAYNVSDFQIWAGCGGCTAADVPMPTESLRTDAEFQELTIEPFTQTRYFSAFPPDDPKEPNFRSFSSNVLLPTNCASRHVTVRLNDTNVARNKDPKRKVRWGAVIGKAERFTLIELLSFPVYVLRNHGDDWNERNYTIYASVGIGILLLLTWRTLMYGLRRFCIGGWADQYRRRSGDCLACTEVVFPSLLWLSCCGRPGRRAINPREWFYSLAILAFNVAAVEMFWHLCIAQFEVEHTQIDSGFWVGIFLILFSQLLPAWYVAVCWNSIRYRQRVKIEYNLANCMPCCNTCGSIERFAARVFCFDCILRRRNGKATRGDESQSGVYCSAGWACASSPSWLFLEFLTALSLLVFFGAGFYVGPVALVFASLLRFSELQSPKNEVAGVITKADKEEFNKQSDVQLNVVEDARVSTESTPLLTLAPKMRMASSPAVSRQSLEAFQAAHRV